MCVAITLAPGGFLTATEIERMNRANADGVGVAWARNGVVQWFKTTKVDTEYIRKAILAWKDYPRLVHFRYTTAGGTRPELCHPFEVGPTANCNPTGYASKVMIHNGHWHRWSDVKELLEKEGLLPDKGPWSDSRLAAYLAHGDPEWFEALGGRVAVLSGDGTIKRLGDWQQLRPDVMVSNKNWDTPHVYTRGGYSGYRQWRGWQWNDDEWAAFEKDQEEKEKRELEETIRLLEEEEKAKAARAKARKEARDAKKASARSGKEGGCADANVCALPEPAVDASPVKATNGKWYQAVNIRGTTEVVEVAPPSEEGAASA